MLLRVMLYVKAKKDTGSDVDADADADTDTDDEEYHILYYTILPTLPNL